MYSWIQPINISLMILASIFIRELVPYNRSSTHPRPWWVLAPAPLISRHPSFCLQGECTHWGEGANMDLALHLTRGEDMVAGACGGGILGAAGALIGMPRHPKRCISLCWAPSLATLAPVQLTLEWRPWPRRAHTWRGQTAQIWHCIWIWQGPPLLALMELVDQEHIWASWMACWGMS